MPQATTAERHGARQRAIALGSLICLAAAAAASSDAPLRLRAAPTATLLCLEHVDTRDPGPGTAIAVLATALSAAYLTGLLWQMRCLRPWES